MKKIKTLNRLDIMLVNSVGDSEVLYMLTLLFATIGSSTLIAGIFIVKNMFIVFLGLFFLLFLLFVPRIRGVKSNYEKIIEKELIQSHYWFSQDFRSNMNIEVTIGEIHKNGKVDFIVFVTDDKYLFKKYLIGSYDKEQLTNIQIVNIEFLKLPKIFSALEEESIYFYKLHSKSSKERFYAEGITTNNQKVEIISSNEDIEIKIDDKTKTTKKLLEITNSYVDIESQGLIVATTRNSKMSKEKECK
ncbi:hypothetical protein [Enterococcus faecium]|uniref:hypothetical protein n=1 Tax=Enterococcus faecium TaxID=1352 RepID=UPI001F0617BF|nr:hypothetical protein [Enterococcus faecium]